MAGGTCCRATWRPSRPTDRWSCWAGDRCASTPAARRSSPKRSRRCSRATPSVYDAVVVGVPSERWGQQVTAVVRPVAGAEVTLDALVEHCPYLAGLVQGSRGNWSWSRDRAVAGRQGRLPLGEATSPPGPLARLDPDSRLLREWRRSDLTTTDAASAIAPRLRRGGPLGADRRDDQAAGRARHRRGRGRDLAGGHRWRVLPGHIVVGDPSGRRTDPGEAIRGESVPLLAFALVGVTVFYTALPQGRGGRGHHARLRPHVHRSGVGGHRGGRVVGRAPRTAATWSAMGATLVGRHCWSRCREGRRSR